MLYCIVRECWCDFDKGFAGTMIEFRASLERIADKLQNFTTFHITENKDKELIVNEQNHIFRVFIPFTPLRPDSTTAKIVARNYACEIRMVAHG